MFGLKRGTVKLEPHDKQWNEIAVQTIKTAPVYARGGYV